MIITGHYKFYANNENPECPEISEDSGHSVFYKSEGGEAYGLLSRFEELVELLYAYVLLVDSHCVFHSGPHH